MTFDPNAQLDPGQITDRRGMGGAAASPSVAAARSASSCSSPTSCSAATRRPRAVLEPGAVTDPESSALATDARPAQDANERDDCRILGYVNSIQAYWTVGVLGVGQHLSAGRHDPVHRARRTSGCGAASAATGRSTARPMSSSTSTSDFFEELETRFGAQGGSLAQGYVLAHEYGHHVQDLLGLLPSAAAAPARPAQSVRTELQADCFAGVWANHAASTGFLEPSPMPRSPTPSMPRRPSATTGSRRRRRARSTPTRGRTARRSSASSGS